LNIESLLQGADALFINDRPTLRWLSGFTGDEGYALVTNDVKLLLVDSRLLTSSFRNQRLRGY